MLDSVHGEQLLVCDGRLALDKHLDWTCDEQQQLTAIEHGNLSPLPYEDSA